MIIKQKKQRYSTVLPPHLRTVRRAKTPREWRRRDLSKAAMCVACFYQEKKRDPKWPNYQDTDSPKTSENYILETSILLPRRIVCDRPSHHHTETSKKKEKNGKKKNHPRYILLQKKVV